MMMMMMIAFTLVQSNNIKLFYCDTLRMTIRMLKYLVFSMNPEAKV